MSIKKYIVNSLGAIFLTGVLAGGFYSYSFKNEQNIPKNDESPSNTKKRPDTLVRLSNEQIKKYGIDVRTPKNGNLDTTISAVGKLTLHPDRVAEVLAPVDGVVIEAKKNTGQYTRAGEVIAVLDSKQIAEAKADYLTASCKENFAASTFDLESSLHEKKISTEQDYLNAKSYLEQCSINTKLAKQKLYTLGFSKEEINSLQASEPAHLGRYEIRAPIDGMIISRSLTRGQYINTTAPIYKIADLSVLWIETGIGPKDFSKLREGQIVQVTGENNRPEQGRVMYLLPIIENENIMSKAIIELDNVQGSWHPGTFATVDITIGNVPIPILVPKESIQKIDGKDCVFITCKDGFRKKVVKVGRKDLSQIEIIKGLNSKDQFAANKTYILKAELNKNSADDED